VPSRRIAPGLVVAALVGGALLRSTPAADVVVEIGEAIVVADGFRAQARTVEPVLYAEGLQLLAATTVRDGVLREAPAVEGADLWSEVVAVYPHEQLVRITQFALVSDGPGGTLALVHRSERSDDGWILSLDPADARVPTALRRTLVHELAHLLTLSRGDVRIARDGEPLACDEVPVDIGCARRGSILAAFHDRFWGAGAGPLGDHVTPYAATSSAEDLAEIFAVVVLDLPLGDGPAVEAKRSWVAQHPDLAPEIERLRARLAGR
jgi:hypothetical protein